ncbi:MAG TPA: hypothetical protein VG860_00315, partial [Terriglobia bacterium]|nr:hypothetical protein [Terriglobia bacterium]
VEAALRDIDRDGLPRNRLATKYCLIMDNKHYPPKEVLKHASARAGTRIRMADGYELFGGEQTNKPLRDLGFTVMRCPDATAHKYPTLPGAGADPP